MRRKLTIAAALAIVLASGTAGAAEMPAYGTKNFVPGADTPSYLSRENAAAPVGAAARDINDRAEVGPVASPAVEQVSPGTSRHGTAHRSSKRHGAAARSGTRSAHAAKGKATHARTASSRKSTAHKTAARSAGVTKVKATKPARSSKPARHAAAKPSARHAAAKPPARHAATKPSARHAVAKPAVKSGRLALSGGN